MIKFFSQGLLDFPTLNKKTKILKFINIHHDCPPIFMFFGTLFYENKDLILKYDFIIRETGTEQERIQTSLHSL